MRRPPIPAELKREVKKLYNNQCAWCGNYNKKELQIHHEDHNPENNVLENLVLICVWCHSLHHNKPSIIEWAYRKGRIE